MEFDIVKYHIACLVMYCVLFMVIAWYAYLNGPKLSVKTYAFWCLLSCLLARIILHGGSLSPAKPVTQVAYFFGQLSWVFYVTAWMLVLLVWVNACSTVQINRGNVKFLPRLKIIFYVADAILTLTCIFTGIPFDHDTWLYRLTLFVFALGCVLFGGVSGVLFLIYGIKIIRRLNNIESVGKREQTKKITWQTIACATIMLLGCIVSIAFIFLGFSPAALIAVQIVDDLFVPLFVISMLIMVKPASKNDVRNSFEIKNDCTYNNDNTNENNNTTATNISGNNSEKDDKNRKPEMLNIVVTTMSGSTL